MNLINGDERGNTNRIISGHTSRAFPMVTEGNLLETRSLDRTVTVTGWSNKLFAVLGYACVYQVSSFGGSDPTQAGATNVRRMSQVTDMGLAKITTSRPAEVAHGLDGRCGHPS